MKQGLWGVCDGRVLQWSYRMVVGEGTMPPLCGILIGSWVECFHKYRCLHTFEVREIQAIVPPYVTTYDEMGVRSVGGRELVKGKRRREDY